MDYTEAAKGNLVRSQGRDTLHDLIEHMNMAHKMKTTNGRKPSNLHAHIPESRQLLPRTGPSGIEND